MMKAIIIGLLALSAGVAAVSYTTRYTDFGAVPRSAKSGNPPARISARSEETGEIQVHPRTRLKPADAVPVKMIQEPANPLLVEASDKRD